MTRPSGTDPSRVDLSSESITLIKRTTGVNENEYSQTLTATIVPPGAEGYVHWDLIGGSNLVELSGLSNGYGKTVTITAKDGGPFGTCSIKATVNDANYNTVTNLIDVEPISKTCQIAVSARSLRLLEGSTVLSDNLTMTENSSKYLTVSVDPSSGFTGSDIVWSCSGPLRLGDSSTTSVKVVTARKLPSGETKDIGTVTVKAGGLEHTIIIHVEKGSE